MATGGKDRNSRAARERARLYQARREFHESQQRRRTRDNLVGAVAAGLIILAAVGAQVVYFTAGPGAPEPTPSSTPSPTTSVEPTPAPEPTAEQTPEPSTPPAP